MKLAFLCMSLVLGCLLLVSLSEASKVANEAAMVNENVNMKRSGLGGSHGGRSRSRSRGGSEDLFSGDGSEDGSDDRSGESSDRSSDGTSEGSSEDGTRVTGDDETCDTPPLPCRYSCTHPKCPGNICVPSCLLPTCDTLDPTTCLISCHEVSNCTDDFPKKPECYYSNSSCTDDCHRPKCTWNCTNPECTAPVCTLYCEEPSAAPIIFDPYWRAFAAIATTATLVLSMF